MCSRLGILSCCKVLFVNLLYSQRGGTFESLHMDYPSPQL